jgi:hypothetical protein
MLEEGEGAIALVDLRLEGLSQIEMVIQLCYRICHLCVGSVDLGILIHHGNRSSGEGNGRGK